MTTSTIDSPIPPSKNRRPVSARASFALLTSILIGLLASSSAPTPLYATYQAKWGFSDVTITVIFGVYAVAVLASLLVFGSLSDHVGRKPMLLVALVIQSIPYAAAVAVSIASALSLPASLLHRAEPQHSDPAPQV